MFSDYDEIYEMIDRYDDLVTLKEQVPSMSAYAGDLEADIRALDSRIKIHCVSAIRKVRAREALEFRRKLTGLYGIEE